jgi:hypothetical protein
MIPDKTNPKGPPHTSTTELDTSGTELSLNELGSVSGGGCRKAGKDQQEFMKFELNNVAMSGYS